MEHIDIRHLPLYQREMDSDFPQVMTEYKQQVAGVDGLLVVSPEHNQSFPAAVKNALDILTRGGSNELRGLPLGIAGAHRDGLAPSTARPSCAPFCRRWV